MGKNYKIWSADRAAKKSLHCKTLSELIDTGKKKLKIDANVTVTVVLEEDGTEVDEEEYFKFLEDNTTFILLKPGESWKESNNFQDVPDAGYDVSDCMEANDDSEEAGSHRSLEKLAKILRSDICNVATFNIEELEILIKTDPSGLSKLINMKEEDTSHFQSTCQQYLDDRTNAQEGVELLKLISNAKQQHNDDGDLPHKKLKK